MSEHLSTEDFSRWIVGERSVSAQQHVRDCARCGGELARMEETLSQYRQTVRDWSDRQVAVVAPVPVRPQPLRWVMAVATLLVITMLPVYRNSLERKRDVERDRADSVLLEQVSAAVAREVPSSMEPLMKLVSYGATPTEGSDKR